MKETLTFLRTENRYSQNAMAKELGISRQAYIKYETGEVEPPVEIIRKLSHILNVSYKTLIDNELNDKSIKYNIAEDEDFAVASTVQSYGVSPINNSTNTMQQIQLKLKTLSQEQLSSILIILQSINHLNNSKPTANAFIAKKRTPGGLDKNLWISEDFDKPLDDFKEYM